MICNISNIHGLKTYVYFVHKFKPWLCTGKSENEMEELNILKVL